MKKCPFCAEENQDEAIFCRYCNNHLSEASIIMKRIGVPFGIARSLDIYLDDEKIGSIRHKETQTFKVPVGDHVIRVKMDWTESVSEPFYLNPNQVLILYCGGRYKSLLRQSNHAMIHPKKAWVVFSD